MNTIFVRTILLTLLLTSCGKKTQVKGVVYSRHNIPVPNVSIDLDAYGSSSDPESSNKAIATTNSNGEYQFEFKGKKVHGKKVSYFAVCNSDSGSFGPDWNNSNAINIGKANTIYIHLK
jgi:hypothetical protein